MGIIEVLESWEVAVVAFALIQVVDVATTMRFLDRGIDEANPIIRFFMERGGEYGWIAVKLAVAAGIAWALFAYAWPWALWLISAAYLPVIFWNMKAGR